MKIIAVVLYIATTNGGSPVEVFQYEGGVGKAMERCVESMNNAATTFKNHSFQLTCIPIYKSE